jgi:hypothetical protein
MNRKLFLAAACAAVVFSAAQAALARDSVKIGFILPMTNVEFATFPNVKDPIKAAEKK